MTSAAGNESTKERTQDTAAPTSATENGSAGGYNNGRHPGSGSFERGGYRADRDNQQERPRAGAMEVHVDHNIEKAMRLLKRKLIKEGLFKELKARRYYEKPSERRKRKEKESKKKVRKEEARAKKNPMLLA